MDYRNMTPNELALMLLYAAERDSVDPGLAREAAHRICPDLVKENIKQRAERYQEMLRSGTSKIQVIKEYRAETGVPLRDAKAYVDGLEEMVSKTEARSGPVLRTNPVPKVVKCDECSAEIGYMPEDVEEHNGRDISGGPDGFKRVKCPRGGCPGHGYIERW